MNYLSSLAPSLTTNCFYLCCKFHQDCLNQYILLFIYPGHFWMAFKIMIPITILVSEGYAEFIVFYNCFVVYL